MCSVEKSGKGEGSLLKAIPHRLVASRAVATFSQMQSGHLDLLIELLQCQNCWSGSARSRSRRDLDIDRKNKNRVS